MTPETEIRQRHREAHEKNGTWLTLHIPKELTYDDAEKLIKEIAERGMDQGRKHDVDIIVTGHSNPGAPR